MKEIETVLKSISEALKIFADGVETIANKIDDLTVDQKSATTAKTEKAKAQAPKTKRKPAPKKTKHRPGTAIETTFGYIKRSRNGITTPILIKKTGFNEKKIQNIIYKLKRQGKIVSKERGIYIST
jgi:DNA replicative helicase MCM subunit Mcm2 (Cdc46/Mcm family)